MNVGSRGGAEEEQEEEQQTSSSSLVLAEVFQRLRKLQPVQSHAVHDAPLDLLPAQSLQRGDWRQTEEERRRRRWRKRDTSTHRREGLQLTTI